MGEWKKIKLGEILEEYCERNIDNKYMPVAVGKYGIRKREEIYSKELSKDISKNKVIRKDTLTIGMGSNQIDIGILVEDEKYCVSPAYTTYKIKNCNSKFLEYYLEYINPRLSDLFMIVSARQGKSVDKEGMLAYSIEIPSLDEQSKICKVLNQIEIIIEKLTIQQNEIEKFKNTIVYEIFQNKEKLNKVKIGEYLSVITDYHSNGAYKKLKENVTLLDKPDYAIMIRTTNLSKNDYENELLYITEKAYNFLEKSKVKENDILMNKIANPGTMYLMPKLNKPVSCGMNLFLIRFSKEVDQKYMFYNMKSVEKEIKNLAHGSTTKTITKDEVRNFELYIHNLSEQKKIVNVLETIDTMKSRINAKSDYYMRLRKALIKRIMTGKVIINV